jgi:glycosyltransferase involved in cell wall biosynthesis
MRAAFLISRLKDGLRSALGPLLPLVRSIRTLPERLRVERQAATLQADSKTSVCYLTNQFPAQPASRTTIAHGGEVKMIFLAEAYPHSYPRASLLYAVSSVRDVGKTEIVRAAKKNGLKIVLNQNGVAFPAWCSTGWEAINAKHQAVYQLADFVIYQSEFCKLSAQKFLGASSAPSTVLYNPVDLSLYRCIPKTGAHQGPVLLLGGNQYEQYRFESAVLALKETLRLLPEARLIVTGKLWGDNQSLAMGIAGQFLSRLGVEKQVEFTGQYSQQEAPDIFGRADLLIHTKFNDPSPNLISEALASGLPVVYSACGGTPELVGEAGIGVEVAQSWEAISLPNPAKMAAAIAEIWSQRATWSEKARSRAEKIFSLEVYIQKHAEIFTSLASTPLDSSNSTNSAERP